MQQVEDVLSEDQWGCGPRRARESSRAWHPV